MESSSFQMDFSFSDSSQERAQTIEEELDYFISHRTLGIMLRKIKKTIKICPAQSVIC